MNNEISQTMHMDEYSQNVFGYEYISDSSQTHIHLYRDDSADYRNCKLRIQCNFKFLQSMSLICRHACVMVKDTDRNLKY